MSEGRQMVPSDTAEHSSVEGVKRASRGLRGDLGAELSDGSPSFGGDARQVLKFHGIYQQDDRDTRAERRREGRPLDHICMVRLGLPGGVLSRDQYLVLDELCDRFGNGTLRATTRQDVQFHFVAKKALPDLLGALNRSLVSTFAACGDVVRNTTCCPAPLADRRRAGVAAHAAALAARYKPRTRAYYELWVDGEKAVTAGPAATADEPLYGDAYLPRKFKIGVAFPGDNCIDVHSNDVGVVPVLGDDGGIEAFTVLVGGGMGRSHNDPTTFPRLADPLATVAAADLPAVLDAVVAVHRDHGDRADRDHARLKYVVEEWGIERFRAEVARRCDRPLAAPAPVTFAASEDHLGWHDQGDGRWFLGVKVDNGRIVDRPGLRLRSALRAVAERYATGVHLTAREDVLLAGIAPGDRAAVDDVLRRHGVTPAEAWVPIRRHSFACPALPTCGLALAESERVFPDVLDALDATLAEVGLPGADLHVRMTGCPNGCARPYTAEVGIVGRGKRSYDVHLGGDPVGTRLNALFAENVPRGELPGVLRPVLEHYRAHRHDGEGFGDFCDRLGVGALRRALGTERWSRRPRPARASAAPEPSRPAPAGRPTTGDPMTIRLGDTAPDFTADTTEGTISLHEYLGDSWGLLFSHPADFTPVCTTELGAFAARKDEFTQRDTKLIGVSVDDVDSHARWSADIAATQGTPLNYPLVGDPDRKVADLYGMIHPNAIATATVRTVFVIAPDKTVRLTLTYPASIGRNVDEILRVLDGLRLSSEFPVSTPVNWSVGDDVIISPSLSDDEARERFPEFTTHTSYLRTTAQPQA